MICPAVSVTTSVIRQPEPASVCSKARSRRPGSVCGSGASQSCRICTGVMRTRAVPWPSNNIAVIERQIYSSYGHVGTATAELFTQDIYCKELMESKPRLTRVIAGQIIVPEQRNVKSAILETRIRSLISPGLHQSGTW